MKQKQFLKGFVAGMLVPIIGSLIWYYLMYKNKGYTLSGYYDAIIHGSAITPGVISRSLLLDSTIFYLFYSRNDENAMRGVLSAIFIYAIPAVYLILFD